MTGSNRRNFLKAAGVGAAAAGAAAAGAAALAPTAVGAAAPAVDQQLHLPAAAAGSMVAYIHDVSTGEVSVMIEGREVTVTDHQLVAKLAHAMHAPSSNV